MYQIIVNILRAAALAVNPTGRFINGRIVDASQAFNGEYPLIVNYPFQVSDLDDDNKQASILLGFWQQDSPDTSVEQREALIAEMDLLQEAFYEHLQELKTIRVTGKVAEPQYQTLQATLSGYAVKFTLTAKNVC